MPGRLTPLITSEIYHVYNRGIDRRPTFVSKFEYLRAIETINYYRLEKPPIRLSEFLDLDEEKKDVARNRLVMLEKIVEIYCYCLIPNHFHFLIRQLRENGVSKFIGNFQNSYTRYFNTRNKRDGSIFLGQFKAVRIETDEQLIHVSRYIHLNPYNSCLVSSFLQLEGYSWSSFPDYLSQRESFVEKSFVLSFFKGFKEYKKFVYDQADYQRKLDSIKHLVFE